MNLVVRTVRVFTKKYNNIWIIAERGYDARDNGIHLFEYINKNHPNINIYYIIDYKSPDYKKVNQIGQTVNYGSLKHYFLFAISKIKISTHIMGYSPDMRSFVWLDRLGLVYGKKAFIQHGIIKDNLRVLHYPKTRLDLFICGAYPEYKYIKENFNHDSEVVQYLGLCRFDKLYRSKRSKPSKEILLMPTWRLYITECKDKEDFKRTEYYKIYQSLINNKELHKILETYGYNLIFYPHIEVQKYLTSFHSKFSNVKIASFSKYDVQELLISSAVLITDFSSVFFDFSYLEKPVIFYQFDTQDYRKNHYEEGYFDYEDDGFGPVVVDEQILLEELGEVLKQDLKIDTKYQDRINYFFPNQDDKNCFRAFNAINKLAKDEKVHK